MEKSKLFSISFYFREIYVQNADEQVENVVRTLIVEELGKLLKGEYHFESEHTLVFKLKSLISTKSSEKSLEILPVLATKLFKELDKLGWSWVTSTCLSQSKAPSTVYFRRKTCHVENMVCVTPVSSDVLFIHADPSLHRLLLKTIEISFVVGGIVKSKSKKDGTLKVQLKGHPWGSKVVEPPDTMFGKRLILNLVKNLEHASYHFYSTVSFDGKLDSMFFAKSLDEEENETTRYFLISLHDPPETVDPRSAVDQLHLIGAPLEMIKSIHHYLSEFWQCVDENILQGSMEFDSVCINLVGGPWRASGWEGAGIKAKIGQLIRHIQSCGWSLVCSLNLSICQNAMSSFMFKETSRNSAQICTMAFHKRSSVFLVDANKDVETVIFETISKLWKPRLKHFEYGPGEHDVHLKLFDRPFDQYAEESTYLKIRHLMEIVILKLNDIGWDVLTSANVSASNNYWPKKLSYSNPLEKYDIHSHTWYLIKKV